MSAREPGDAPLPAVARELLAAYRSHRRMPAPAFARVERRLARAPTHGLRVAVIAAAAAAITIAALVGLQSITASRRDAEAGRDLAGDVRVQDPTRQGATDDGGDARGAVAEPPVRGPATPPSTPATGDHGDPPRGDLDDDVPGPPSRPRAPRRDDAATSGEDATPGASSMPTSTLAAERALLGRAQRALTDGQLATARSIAAEHRRRFPEGVLRPELMAIDAVARCRGGEGDASAVAAAFAGAHPGSPLRATVDEACSPR